MKGASREATAAFFRVVPGDYIQGHGMPALMTSRAPDVGLFDFQLHPQGLSDAAQSVLEARRVTTRPVRLRDTVTDFSSLRPGPSMATFRFFLTQKPGDAQNIAQQLLEQDGAPATARTTPPSSRCRGRTSRTSPRTSAASPTTSLFMVGRADCKETVCSGLRTTSRAQAASSRDQEGLRQWAGVTTAGRCPQRQEDERSTTWTSAATSLLDEVDVADDEFRLPEIQSNGWSRPP